VALVPASSHPSGGFTPVTVYLDTGLFDIHDAGVHALKWTVAHDNPWDYNVLLSLPAGLGLTTAINGTGDGSITTTEAGTWAFSLVAGVAGDVTWTGSLRLDDNTSAAQSGNGAVNGSPRMNVAQTVYYPSGAAFTPAFVTVSAATADPYNNSASLVIVRLA
jgi:hypothetical protein